MVEGKALYEWSPEVAIALSTRFCSWVVAEEDAEHNLEETEESKSVLLQGHGGRRGSRFGSTLKVPGDRSNSQISLGARRASSSGNMQNTTDEIARP